MPNDAAALISYVLGFALVAARIGGAFLFVPIPGLQQTSWPAKILLVLAITFSLFPLWPAVDLSHPVMGLLLSGLAKEACIGISLGLVVALSTECVGFGFHLVGIQAGFGFASTIDPTSQADTPVLESLGRVAAGLLFFALGLHREIIRAFAISLRVHPAGTWTIGPGMIEPTIRLFQLMLATGLRLALPIIACMTMIDIALGLIGRISPQSHLLHLAFPAKVIASMLLISWTLVALPAVFGEFATRLLTDLRAAIGM